MLEVHDCRWGFLKIRQHERKDETPSGNEWGQLVSESPRTTGGNGEEFSGANAICHAD